MLPHSTLTALSYFTVFVMLGFLCSCYHHEKPPLNEQDTEPPLDVRDVKQVRDVFHTHDFDARVRKQRQYLIHMGEEAFPAYETILSDPSSPPGDIIGVFAILCKVKADRSCFLDHVVSRLADQKSSIRWSAVSLLEQIGSSAEASPVVALLSDEDRSNGYAAAKTLSSIGGPHEVVAMDVWLHGVSHRNDGDLRRHVKQCREALKKRLDRARAHDGRFADVGSLRAVHSAPILDAQDSEPPVDVRNVDAVRLVFHVQDYDERQRRYFQYLIRMGEKVFPTYKAILSDPKSPFDEIAGVFHILRKVKADRRCFIDYAISRLADKKDAIRLSAVELLEQIGSPAEASPVVALLSDEDGSIPYSAAKTLAAIGGPNEVVAMDVWLRGVSHRERSRLREHVQKCRDDLQNRLAAKKDPTK